MSDTNGQGNSRLDRMEKLMELLIADHVKFGDEHEKFLDEHEKFLDEHKRLLTAQVVLTDRVDKLAVLMGQLAEAQVALTLRVDRLAVSVGELTEAQKHTDEGLNALRKRPPQAS